MTSLTREKELCLAFAQNALKAVPAPEEARALANLSTEALLAAAEEVTQTYANQTFNFCGIVNAKSGRCSEDCLSLIHI